MKNQLSFFFYLSLNFLFLIGLFASACNNNRDTNRENYDLNDPLNKNDHIPTTPRETNTNQTIQDTVSYDSPPAPSMK